MSYRKKHIKPKIKKLRKKKKFFQKPIFWTILLFLALSITVVYFVLFSPKFKVTKIEISGNEQIENSDIESLVVLKASDRIFLIDTDKLKHKILYEFPSVESVVIERKLPGTLILKISERKPFAVFCPNFVPISSRTLDFIGVEDPRLLRFDRESSTLSGLGNRDQNNKCFFMDRNGVVFEELKNTPKDMFIIQREPNSEQIFLGNNIVKKNIMEVIYKVRDNLRNNFQIELKEVFIKDYLIFKTSENWLVYFDPISDIDLQITKISTLLKDEISPEKRKNLQYIYLQYKDRAYYK